MFWLFVVSLWSAMILSPVLLLFLFLPVGRDCPRCGIETVPIRSRLLHPLRTFAQLRWCMSCGWEGVARRVRTRAPAPALEAVPENLTEAGGDAPWQPGTM